MLWCVWLLFSVEALVEEDRVHCLEVIDDSSECDWSHAVLDAISCTRSIDLLGDVHLLEDLPHELFLLVLLRDVHVSWLYWKVDVSWLHRWHWSRCQLRNRSRCIGPRSCYGGWSSWVLRDCLLCHLSRLDDGHLLSRGLLHRLRCNSLLNRLRILWTNAYFGRS